MPISAIHVRLKLTSDLLGCTVKPVYSGHLWAAKKVVVVGRWSLYRVFDHWVTTKWFLQRGGPKIQVVNRAVSLYNNSVCVYCLCGTICLCYDAACSNMCERCYNSTFTCSRCSHCNADEYEMCEPPEHATRSQLMSFTTEYCGESCEGPGLAEANGDLFNFCGE